MLPEEIVKFVESEMSQYRSCPLCGQYGGLEQHQSGCLYLTYKGEVTTPEEGTDVGDSHGADGVSADETPLPALTKVDEELGEAAIQNIFDTTEPQPDL